MSLLISHCMRTTLCCWVLSSPHVAKQASKLRSIITQGIPQLLHSSVTKFHTNWPHQLRNPETDLYWVGVWLRIVWRETCIIKVASLWNRRHPGIDTDAGWLQTVASFFIEDLVVYSASSGVSIDLSMHTYPTRPDMIMRTHRPYRFLFTHSC